MEELWEIQLNLRNMKYWGILGAVTAIFAVAATVVASGGGGGGLWLMGGQDLHNNRNNPNENKIGTENVGDLSVKWVYDTLGDVSATPAVDGNYVYVPDFGGGLHKIDRETGATVWSTLISDYTGLPGDFARTTPAIHGDLLIFGDQAGRLFTFTGASIMAVNKHTGDLEWLVPINDHPFAIITQSAVVHGNTAYVGVSSFEELAAAIIPGYVCCTFRGSVLALNANTGEIKWRTYTAPEPATPTTFPRFSGNAVWGSTPVVDTKRNSLYVATGNNYTVDADMLDCILTGPADETCNVDGNFFDALVSLDLKTGEVNWANSVLPFDTWNVACFPELFPGALNPENCQDTGSPDYDFGQGPALFTVKGDKGKPRDLVGAGQKSGIYWALDPNNGEIVWSTQVGPGSAVGGLQWGSATDGERIYNAVSNGFGAPWTLPNGDITTRGLWSAMDPATGEILWQTEDPGLGGDQAAVSVANGVLYGCSMFPGQFGPNMHAMDASTGEILWSFGSPGSCNAGPAIVNGTVYWGSGYAGFGVPGDNKFYAFSTD